MFKFAILLISTEVTIIFMFAVTEFTLLAIVPEYAWNLHCVVKNLDLIELITDIFTILFHLAIFKESFILCVQNGLLVVA